MRQHTEFLISVLECGMMHGGVSQPPHEVMLSPNIEGVLMQEPGSTAPISHEVEGKLSVLPSVIEREFRVCKSWSLGVSRVQKNLEFFS